LWKSKCQPKHKVFFWLLLKNRLNTRSFLRRRSMALDSFTCDNYILQMEETVIHLFFRCNFARRCWLLLDIRPPRTTDLLHTLMRIRGVFGCGIARTGSSPDILSRPSNFEGQQGTTLDSPVSTLDPEPNNLI
jgi:hypothetical protein